MLKTSKNHLITSSEFTYMCFYIPLLQSCLGAPRSGPEVRGPTFGARRSGPDSCGTGMPKTSKPFDYIIRVHIHVFLHAIATKLPGSTPFGARRSGPDSCSIGICQKPFDYIIRVHIHVFLHAIATKLPGSTPFGARRSGPDSCGIGMPKTI